MKATRLSPFLSVEQVHFHEIGQTSSFGGKEEPVTRGLQPDFCKNPVH